MWWWIEWMDGQTEMVYDEEENKNNGGICVILFSLEPACVLVLQKKYCNHTSSRY